MLQKDESTMPLGLGPLSVLRTDTPIHRVPCALRHGYTDIRTTENAVYLGFGFGLGFRFRLGLA